MESILDTLGIPHGFVKSLKPYHVPIKQTDGYNCGIFITAVIRALDVGVEIDSTFQPDKKRVEYMNEILETSDDMTNDCLYCENHDNDDKWVQCDWCFRWLHQKCTRKTMDFESNYYICDLCKSF